MSEQRKVASAVAVCLLIAAGAALALHAMGRQMWCTCGTIRLWYGNAWGPENSQQFADPYTFTHVTHGILLYGLVHLVARRAAWPTRLMAVIGLESLWEVLENTNTVIDRYRSVTMALGYYGDSVFNSMGDIAACGAGFALAALLPPRLTAALVVIFELGLTLWIRDSLLLNIVMLLHPFEAIRAWQLAG